MAKYIAQVIVLGAQVVGRAFARALQQEYNASKAAAQRGASHKSQQVVNVKHGMSIEEAKDILNVENLDTEAIKKSYEHLFAVNDKAKGGSLYLQSKVVRAKERLDEEITVQNPSNDSKADQNKTS